MEEKKDIFEDFAINPSTNPEDYDTAEMGFITIIISLIFWCLLITAIYYKLK